MKKTSILMILFLASSYVSLCAEEKLHVLCSTSDLGYFAREIGGEHVSVDIIADPKRDPHFVEVRPSFMIKARKADVVLKVGMELDLWMDLIMDGSRNSDAVIVDCSKHVLPVEIPKSKVDASRGELHRYGNPHYWMTPDNVKPMTDAIVSGFTELDKVHEEFYRENQRTLIASISATVAGIQSTLDELKGNEVVYYHNAWPYFNDFTGLKAFDFIEPYPGVAPSPTHIKELIELIQSQRIKIIAVDVYFDDRVPRKIADATEANVVTVYPSLGANEPDQTYEEWLVGNILSIAEALK